MADEYEYDNTSSEQVDGLVNSLNKKESENIALNQALNSSQNDKKDSNFLHVQISNEEMLEKLEHYFRGERLIEDKDGNVDWRIPNNNQELVTFNDYGVSSMMEIITRYIDKNTSLSYYSEERIYEILADIGDELVLFILCNYKKMGMDNYQKKTKFRVMITTTLHLIESTYRRAVRGKTMEEINQSKVVSQFNNPEMPNYPQQPQRGRIARFFGNR